MGRLRLASIQPPPPGFFIDANLLVLLLVGHISIKFIPRHRRLSGYSVADYYALAGFRTPSTLTETSNLPRQHAEPERSA